MRYYNNDIVEIINLSEYQIDSMYNVKVHNIIGQRYKVEIVNGYWSSTYDFHEVDAIQCVGWNHGKKIKFDGVFNFDQIKLVYRPIWNWVKYAFHIKNKFYKTE